MPNSILAKFSEKLVNIVYGKNHRAWLMRLVGFFVLIGPVVFMVNLDYRHTEEHLTEMILSQRESIVHTAVVLLEEKFDRLTDIGVSLATRVKFRQLLKEGKWEEAVRILEDVPSDFPFIDRLFVADPAGTLMADTPEHPDVRGKNFAFRDWYKGATETGKPYISEVYKRTARPQFNVIAVATPIIDDESQNMLGILVMQVRLDTILGWAQEIEAGPTGFVYFADRNGHVAGHPGFPAQAEIVSFSEVPAVEKALKGERGAEVFYNQIEKEEQVVAYEQVPEYGWGAIVQQSNPPAFAWRDEDLRKHILIDSEIIFFTLLVITFVFRFGDTLNMYRQREKIFLESVGDGLVAIDRQWNITFFNKTASVLTGYSQKEVLGKPFREILKFIREKDGKEYVAFIEEAMVFGETRPMENHILLIGKDGREFYVGDSASPLFDQNKQVVGAIIIFRDISKLRELQKAKEEFASLASHQLRAPVTVIRGYAEMLLEKSALNPKDKSMLENINRAAGNMSELVNALLNVSRIELGTLDVNPEAAYLPDIADGVLKELALQIKNKGLILEKTYDKAVPVINVDVKLIQAVFRNLFSNAVRYTPDKGRINLEISKRERDILIKVADTGYGIPKDEQSKIFTKFFRASNVAEKESGGTGLGLYLVKSIVEQSGGRIWFESEENKGATFFVTIPLEGMKKKEGIKGLS